MHKAVVFRRPTPLQGRALEVLGHAVEYLVDSYSARGTGDECDTQAIAILHRLSRDVFAECREVISFRERIRRWFRRFKPHSRHRQSSSDQNAQRTTPRTPSDIGKMQTIL